MVYLIEPEPVAVSVGTFVVGVESSAAVVPNAFVADASVTWTSSFLPRWLILAEYIYLLLELELDLRMLAISMAIQWPKEVQLQDWFSKLLRAKPRCWKTLFVALHLSDIYSRMSMLSWLVPTVSNTLEGRALWCWAT